MEEKFEQFVSYFRNSNCKIKDITSNSNEVKLTIELGGAPAVIKYSGYMVTILHYLFPVREHPMFFYDKINTLDSKFRSMANIGLNCEKFNGQEYVYCAFANMGNGNGYADADTFFEKFNQSFEKIEPDLRDLKNYL